DGDDSLVGEGLQERDLVVTEWHGLRSLDRNGSNRLESAQHRCAKKAADPQPREGSCRLNIRQVDDLPGRNRAPRPRHFTDAECSGESASHRLNLFAAMAMTGDIVNDLALEPKDCTHSPGAELDRSSYDRVEYRLFVSRRARDDLKNFRRRGLLAQRPNQIVVTRLQFLEQANVLDRDAGLVGEGLEQGNLFVCEGIYLHPAKQERADRHSLPQQRNAQDRSVALGLGMGCRVRKFIRLSLRIS